MKTLYGMVSLIYIYILYIIKIMRACCSVFIIDKIVQYAGTFATYCAIYKISYNALGLVMLGFTIGISFGMIINMRYEYMYDEATITVNMLWYLYTYTRTNLLNKLCYCYFLCSFCSQVFLTDNTSTNTIYQSVPDDGCTGRVVSLRFDDACRYKPRLQNSRIYIVSIFIGCFRQRIDIDPMRIRSFKYNC